ncbi:helix-turn-helix domain-containing protein [Maricurvus nonylphenolicus]|uniref:winged helix-turn-helix transcriptional regulator n=1 Tax=Maricurvus nonylphenolicus TaxID=1008307 RepID=UPI0036F2C4C3
MKWAEHADNPCAIAKTLAVIGESWSLLILRNCFLGTRRFEEFQQQLGMTRHVLTDRLKHLVEHEVLKKVPYGESSRRFEYRLTERGKGLYPVIMSLVDWGNQWMVEAGEEPIIHIHQTCGQRTRPVMSCSACGEELNPKDVTAVAGKPLQSLQAQYEEEELAAKIGYQPPAANA